MNTYSLSHLSDSSLLHGLTQLAARDRSITAELLAHIAEVDARKLYLPMGYGSMFAYCVEALRLSDDAANKRIRVARLARAYPRLFGAIANGRLHMSSVSLLGTYLTPERAEDLLTEAYGKSRSEIEEMLARRFPQTESMPLIEAHPASLANFLPAPGPAGCARQESVASRKLALHPARAVAPIAAERFSLHVTIGIETRKKLRHAQELLSHAIPNGELAEVLDRVLDLAIRQLEKQKFAATDRPRCAKPPSDPRHIPAHVRRAVVERDGHQCSFVGESGRRCPERRRLEFDHVVPVGRGGESKVDNVRMLCRAHNQYAAERAYGVEFMQRKRPEAEDRKARAAVEEVIPWLRGLGLRAEEARRAAELCASMPEATLEDRVKRALTGWLPRGAIRIPAPGLSCST